MKAANASTLTPGSMARITILLFSAAVATRLRAASGAAPLELQAGLVRAAERHSYEMMRNGGHDSADGSGCRARIADTCGPRTNGRWHVAENHAWRAAGVFGGRAVSVVTLDLGRRG